MNFITLVKDGYKTENYLALTNNEDFFVTIYPL